MSIFETEHTRTRRKQQSRRKRKHTVRPRWSSLDEPLSASHPDQILSFHEWCRLNRISVRTGQRIIDRGEVVVTQLTPRRIGISNANNARWQASRERG
jgi:hypothetical protein